MFSYLTSLHLNVQLLNILAHCWLFLTSKQGKLKVLNILTVIRISNNLKIQFNVTNPKKKTKQLVLFFFLQTVPNGCERHTSSFNWRELLFAKESQLTVRQIELESNNNNKFYNKSDIRKIINQIKVFLGKQIKEQINFQNYTCQE